MKQAPNRFRKFSTYLCNNYQYYLLLILPAAFYLIFKYMPMHGILIAFQDYNFMKGVWASPWVGLDVFEEVFKDKTFWNAFWNTLRLNGLALLIGFPIPIIFALFLNEIRSNIYKRVIQSISYLPHFISWVIIYGLILAFTSKETGLLNMFIRAIGGTPINFLTNKGWWLFLYIFSGVWKEMGWSAIIYFSALSAVNPELYEAAAIDGAGRFRCMWNITLPSIKNTIVIMLLLAIGRIISIGFDQPYMLGNVMVTDVSTVLSTYIYEMGIVRAQFSFTAAVGLFQAVINFTLLLLADAIAKLSGEQGIFGRREG